MKTNEFALFLGVEGGGGGGGGGGLEDQNGGDRNGQGVAREWGAEGGRGKGGGGGGGGGEGTRVCAQGLLPSLKKPNRKERERSRLGFRYQDATVL